MLGRMDISEVLDFDHGALEQAALPAAPLAALPVQIVAVPPGVAVPPSVAVPPCPWPPPDGDDIQLLRMIHNMVDVVLQLEDPEPHQPYQSVLTFGSPAACLVFGWQLWQRQRRLLVASQMEQKPKHYMGIFDASTVAVMVNHFCLWFPSLLPQRVYGILQAFYPKADKHWLWEKTRHALNTMRSSWNDQQQLAQKAFFDELRCTGCGTTSSSHWSTRFQPQIKGYLCWGCLICQSRYDCFRMTGPRDHCNALETVQCWHRDPLLTDDDPEKLLTQYCGACANYRRKRQIWPPQHVLAQRAVPTMTGPCDHCNALETVQCWHRDPLLTDDDPAKLLTHYCKACADYRGRSQIWPPQKMLARRAAQRAVPTMTGPCNHCNALETSTYWYRDPLLTDDDPAKLLTQYCKACANYRRKRQIWPPQHVLAWRAARHAVPSMTGPCDHCNALETTTHWHRDPLLTEDDPAKLLTQYCGACADYRRRSQIWPPQKVLDQRKKRKPLAKYADK
ncbi:hypothetical protein HDU87_001800 [Geranomyces variabilis]|uniref:Uncharacterized protein n=1 Tax=Geranomyces variabilis TaxID=109894 RepID=A0AAD5TMK0_9FUNG|nr:hypothetical protein HDU87_001800 [Geranomyces variabilis]